MQQMRLDVLLCTCLIIGVASARQLNAVLDNDSNKAFACGKAGSACGASIPAGVQCPKGPGFCEAGTYCGWEFSDTSKKTICMPIPKACGSAEGSPCCPGNARVPAPLTDALPDGSRPAPKPTCADGLTCFFTPTMGGNGWSAPPYASPAGALLGTCKRVPSDCGATGKACCPGLYHVGTNPPLEKQLCTEKGAFCQPGASGGGSGTCVLNKPGCGTIGATCCVFTGGVSVDSFCGAMYGQPGPRGYCAYPGGRPTGDMRDQRCMSCPSPAVVKANPNPNTYWGCPSA